MAELLGRVFKAASGASSAPGPAATDDDFAEFASASPATPLLAAESLGTLTPLPFAASSTPLGAAGALASPWWAVWERHSLDEFYTEGYILLFIAFVVGIHLWGSRRNRSIARGFLGALAPVLAREFALVGFSKKAEANSGGDGAPPLDVDAALKGVSHMEFVSYASGRQNIAFMHTTIKLQRRHNPIAWIVELAVSFFFDSIPTPKDSITMTISPFDGNEPTAGRPSSSSSGGKSTFDNFVWAIVNKRNMRRWRDERYDLSLTRTSDCEGLPPWVAVMGESKEVGDLCLYQPLKDVVGECGNFLEFLVVTDMPKEKPTKLSGHTPRKRITLELTLPSLAPGDDEVLRRLASAYVRLVDHLVASAHFRPEVLRKVRATRDDEIRKLKRAIDEEGKEEREVKLAEKKKAERDTKLRNMSAAEQKKFLEKEREKERKDAMKKQTRKA